MYSDSNYRDTPLSSGLIARLFEEQTLAMFVTRYRIFAKKLELSMP